MTVAPIHPLRMTSEPVRAGELELPAGQHLGSAGMLAARGIATRLMDPPESRFWLLNALNMSARNSTRCSPRLKTRANDRSAQFMNIPRAVLRPPGRAGWHPRALQAAPSPAPAPVGSPA